MSLDDAIAGAVERALDAHLTRVTRLQEADAKIDDRQLVTEADAARICGVSAGMLRDLRAAGKIRPHRRSRPILYRCDQIKDIVRLLAD